MTLDDLFEAWRVNDVVNHRLLALCPDEAFEMKPGKGKTIRSNWVHLIGVRRSHVEEKMRREAEAVPKLDWKTATREEIAAALDQTCELTKVVFEKLEAKPTRWTAAKFFAYSVAHEAHHRAQIDFTLRLNGFEYPEMAMYGLWDWPKL